MLGNMLEQLPSTEKLLLEIASLRQEIEILQQEKADLEILLDTMTEHSDVVESQLQNQADETIKESEKRLRQFLEAMPLGILVLHVTGELYYANPIAKKLAVKKLVPRFQANELPDFYPMYKIGTNRVYPLENFPLIKALQGKNTTIDDIEIRHHNYTIPLEVKGTPIFDDKGNIVFAIAIFQDITERKKAEAESLRFTNELFELNQSLSRFVPRQFLQLLDKKSIVDIQLGDQTHKEMSVLFSDIRDFTTLSETLTPTENFQFINSYLSCMEPAIIHNNGFIDKYVGDEIMALFSGCADDAVKAGIAMLDRKSVV